MGKSVKLMIVAGARPNFMKIAPLIHEIQSFDERAENARTFEYRLVHTGQHYDSVMSDVFFRELNIPAPDINLEVGSGSHAEQTARIMMAFEPVCLHENPDWIVVVGDVNSTMACTLVASKLGIRVVHLEAGLRSFDRTMPEEINRVVTDALADLLLTPSTDAVENLKHEGVLPSKICLVGNIMIDTLVANLDQARKSCVAKQLGIKPKDFVYVTLHRPSNVDDKTNLEMIMRELTNLARHLPVVFPVHPRTRKKLIQFSISSNGNAKLMLLDPIGYHDSLYLTENARFVLTDSGGLQEESTYFQTPCLTLRPNTERPVTIEVGTNKLTRPDQLTVDIEDIIQNRRSRGEIPLYWDGRTAGRTLSEIMKRSQ